MRRLLTLLFGLAVLPLGACAGTQADADSADPAALTGRTWQVEDIAAAGIIDRSHMTLTLGPDGRASGDTGCNRFGGPYNLSGAALSFGDMMSTRRGCAPALMEQERRYLDALKGVSSWSLRPDGALLLQGAGGPILYRLEAESSGGASPGETRFVCEDGSELSVFFDSAAGTATIASGGGPIVLPQAPSGSGFRYETPTHSLTGKGRDITWTIGRMVPRRCTAS
ncbi:META domain-containing protein [Iodidimonas sp. SYSU 1G8]|uniref:META domain-containing protein n=1 Tax=Iodidimonas sp. SYSU 1G8 TaxID=3133967 RepID=UPI0031FEC853